MNWYPPKLGHNPVKDVPSDHHWNFQDLPSRKNLLKRVKLKWVNPGYVKPWLGRWSYSNAWKLPLVITRWYIYMYIWVNYRWFTVLKNGDFMVIFHGELFDFLEVSEFSLGVYHGIRHRVIEAGSLGNPQQSKTPMPCWLPIQAHWNGMD